MQRTTDALAFASVDAKFRYDEKHRPLTMRVRDKAFVKLHKGYRLPSLDNPIIANQRARPFEVLERIDNLAYRLYLPSS